jgi:hypothetical protein
MAPKDVGDGVSMEDFCPTSDSDAADMNELRDSKDGIDPDSFERSLLTDEWYNVTDVPDDTDEPEAVQQRKLGDIQKMALQIGVGRKMFAPDCIYSECRYDSIYCVEAARGGVIEIYLGEGKTMLHSPPVH